MQGTDFPLCGRASLTILLDPMEGVLGAAGTFSAAAQSVVDRAKNIVALLAGPAPRPRFTHIALNMSRLGH